VKNRAAIFLFWSEFGRARFFENRCCSVQRKASENGHIGAWAGENGSGKGLVAIQVGLP